MIQSAPDIAIVPRRAGPRAAAFTLVELLITITIIAVLIALLFPAVRGAVATARGFRCQMSLRSTAFDFSLFADESLHPPRGDDASDLPSNAFRVETFQELQYGIDEFWTYGSVSSVALPDRQGRDPMRCSEVKGDLVVRRNTPCSSGGVGPAENVSYGFNGRLQYSDRQIALGKPATVLLTSNIMNAVGEASPEKVPLVFDVDGVAAAAAGQSGTFSAPGLGMPGLFADDAFWFPGMRHWGAMNVAFLDGRVASTRKPLGESGWAWGFDPGN